MRKLILLLLLFVLVLSLISCEPVAYYFKENTRNDEVVGVELIIYNSDDVAVTESTDNMLDFQSNNMEILEVLDTTKITDFIFEFGDIEFFLGYPHLNTPNGIGIRIIYENGDFLVVTASLLNEDHDCNAIMFNSEGSYKDFFGGLSWKPSFIDLINKYFQTQIE